MALEKEMIVVNSYDVLNNFVASYNGRLVFLIAIRTLTLKLRSTAPTKVSSTAMNPVFGLFQVCQWSVIEVLTEGLPVAVQQRAGSPQGHHFGAYG